MLTIHINVIRINSIDAIKADIIKVIDNIYNEIVESSKRSNERIPKINMSDFDIILMVGDMKTKGVTNESIAKKLFPRDFNPDKEPSKPESAIRKVSHYYNTYKEMIGGKYKLLRYA
jgi:hypothetical protein